MGMLIYANGEQTAVSPSNGTFSLNELQTYVEGFIEIVPIDDARMAIVNDEGLLKKMPMNPVASQVAGRLLVGPVLIVSPSEVE